MKKLFSLQIILFLMFMVLNTVAYAGHEVSIKEGGLTITLYVDAHKRVEILGLPVEDQFFYDAYKKRLIVKPKRDSIAYSVDVKNIALTLPEGELYSPLNAPIGQRIGFNTRRWNASVYGKFCHAVKGSTQVSDLLGLTLQDIGFISIGVGYVLAEDFSKDTCSYFYTPTALAQIVGFPMEITESRSGISTYTTKIRTDDTLKEIVFPKVVKPLDDKTYISFLKKRLNREALSSYLRTENQLTSDYLRVKSLRFLLADPKNQKAFKSSNKTDLSMPRAKTIVVEDLDRSY